VIRTAIIYIDINIDINIETTAFFPASNPFRSTIGTLRDPTRPPNSGPRIALAGPAPQARDESPSGTGFTIAIVASKTTLTSETTCRQRSVCEPNNDGVWIPRRTLCGLHDPSGHSKLARWSIQQQQQQRRRRQHRWHPGGPQPLLCAGPSGRIHLTQGQARLWKGQTTIVVLQKALGRKCNAPENPTRRKTASCKKNLPVCGKFSQSLMD